MGRGILLESKVKRQTIAEKEVMKSANFVIPLTPFPFDVMVSIAETDEELFRKLRDKLPEEYHEHIEKYAAFKPTGQGRYILFGNGASLIRIKRTPESPEDKGYLSHEIFHCVEFLMDKVSVKYSIKSSETWAYMIGYLTTEIYRRLQELK